MSLLYPNRRQMAHILTHSSFLATPLLALDSSKNDTMFHLEMPKIYFKDKIKNKQKDC